MSDLVGNPEDRFSHNEAHLIERLEIATIAAGVSMHNSHPLQAMQK